MKMLLVLGFAFLASHPRFAFGEEHLRDSEPDSRALTDPDLTLKSFKAASSACFYVSILKDSQGEFYHARFGWGRAKNNSISMTGFAGETGVANEELLFSRSSKTYRVASGHSEKLFECCGLKERDFSLAEERLLFLKTGVPTSLTNTKVKKNCAGRANFVLHSLGPAKLPNFWNMSTAEYTALSDDKSGFYEVASLNSVLEKKVEENTCSVIVHSDLATLPPGFIELAEKAHSLEQKFAMWSAANPGGFSLSPNNRLELFKLFVKSDPMFKDYAHNALDKMLVANDNNEWQQNLKCYGLKWSLLENDKQKEFLTKAVLSKYGSTTILIEVVRNSTREQLSRLRVIARKIVKQKEASPTIASSYDTILNAYNLNTDQEFLDQLIIEGKLPKDVKESLSKASFMRVLDFAPLKDHINSPYPSTLQTIRLEDLLTKEKYLLQTWGRFNHKTDVESPKLKKGYIYKTIFWKVPDSLAPIGVASFDIEDPSEKVVFGFVVPSADADKSNEPSR